MTDSFLSTAKIVNSTDASFCKFISANDVGKTGGHQAGFYVSKEAAKELFDCDCIKGTIEDRWFQISWQNGAVTKSRFVYYGQKTRDESRITNFGRDFEYMQEEYVGSLIVISKVDSQNFYGSVLSADEDIDEFLEQHSIPFGTKSCLIRGKVSSSISPDERLNKLLMDLIARYNDFPDTVKMSKMARECFNSAFHISDRDISLKPDKTLMKWIETESSLFYLLEDKIYRPIYTTAFNSVEEFTKTANEVLNRRKSRAGKSLEHHLSQVFLSSRLKFEEQCVTEDNKKPDFLFPGGIEYHNLLFPGEDLVFLGAKTTCKDRWRQVLNEAERIEFKYLFTLQPGISSNQLQEMKHEKLSLVVPESNIKCFAKEYQGDLLSLKSFVELVREKQAKYHYFQ